MSNMSIYRNENIRKINDFLMKISIVLSNTTELERQLLASFVFGVIYAGGRERGLNPSEIHALSILSLQDFFQYSPEQAYDFTGLLIEAASNKEEHKVMNAIIHCGIRGYDQWKIEDYPSLKKDIETIFNEFKK
ncbi:hypothetical protein F975_02065 [Acinetobacter sp. ANC 3789]|nr:hypothetical protein F975_02065 [Acinetobacter sp. ANC 3789]